MAPIWVTPEMRHCAALGVPIGRHNGKIINANHINDLRACAGKMSKTLGGSAYTGWPRHRTRAGRGGTAGCPEMPSRLPR